MREPLIANNGKIFTDGKTYGTVVYPAEGVDKESFYEIDYAEYEAKTQEEAEAILRE